MKKLRLLFFIGCFIFFSSITYTQNDKILDEKNGFRNYKFGDSISNPIYRKFVFVCTISDGTDYYVNPEEKLTIGDYKLEYISFGFYNKKLYSITLNSKNDANNKGILEVHILQYGQPVKDNPALEHYIWMGKKVYLIYDENMLTEEASISYVYLPIDNQIIKDTKRKNIKAQNDL